ncbi:transcription antiterminator BlgG [Paracoccus sp. (in: a-proteobacteria)]|uniref:transcription antiterminator BlgG n=1 Tax=Paracoccus sp. TaxID=267 RepID=UPI002AFDCDA1|nr:transcription antiterminator BlgG [Paracoccus sp. (in: a-proteobacteria)]
MTLPHHQPIRELMVSPDAGQQLRAGAERLLAWDLTAAQLAELELLTSGAFFPLRGFLTQADCDSVAEGMRLTSGALWPVPVVLDVAAEFADRVEPGEDIALRGPQGAVLAILSVTDKWRPEGGGPPAVSGESSQPGATFGVVRLGGPVKGLPAVGDAGHGPNGWRAHFRTQDCKRVLACDPADEVAAARLADELGAVLLPLKIAPFHIGPRAALWQALVCRNHGATHLLLPADPATQALLRQYREEVGLVLVEPEDATGL